MRASACVSVVSGRRAAVARRTAHRRVVAAIAHTASVGVIVVLVDDVFVVVVAIIESVTGATVVAIPIPIPAPVHHPLAVEESRPTRLHQRSTGRLAITIAETIRVR